MPPKRFVFRLQTVLEVREKEEEEEKRRLSDCIAHEKQQQAILADYSQRKAETRGMLKAAQVTGQPMTVDKLRQISNYLQKLGRGDDKGDNKREGLIGAQIYKVEEAAAAVEHQRQVLIQAVIERKKVENLKEQQHKEFLDEIEEEEKRVLDELATLKYARDMTMRVPDEEE